MRCLVRYATWNLTFSRVAGSVAWDLWPPDGEFSEKRQSGNRALFRYLRLEKLQDRIVEARGGFDVD